MNWLKRLFRGKNITESETVEIPNRWGVGDGNPFITPHNPNISEIFANATKTERNILPYAYLNHPDAQVRLATVAELKKLGDYHLSNQSLVDRLADPSRDICRAAANALWTNDKAVENALRCLSDEIHRSGLASTMSSKEAIVGLGALRDEVPPAKTAQFEEWVAEIIGRKYSKTNQDTGTHQGSTESSTVIDVKSAAVQSLLEVCPNVTIWMRDDPSPPMVRIRDIGKELNSKGGKMLMQAVHAEFVRSGGAEWSRHIEMMWSGIGSWRG